MPLHDPQWDHPSDAGDQIRPAGPSASACDAVSAASDRTAGRSSHLKVARMIDFSCQLIAVSSRASMNGPTDGSIVVALALTEYKDGLESMSRTSVARTTMVKMGVTRIGRLARRSAYMPGQSVRSHLTTRPTFAAG